MDHAFPNRLVFECLANGYGLGERGFFAVLGFDAVFNGATHFQMRRMPKVASEMALHVLAYNMKRVMQFLGVGGFDGRRACLRRVLTRPKGKWCAASETHATCGGFPSVTSVTWRSRSASRAASPLPSMKRQTASPPRAPITTSVNCGNLHRRI